MRCDLKNPHKLQHPQRMGVYSTHLKHIWSLKKDLCREIFEEDVTEELTGFRHK